ncbi:hypothetical protein [Actinoplanes auranticolor]|uniref:hypothetical protein n=1 Tax=Actinoplanes auranticolor TaxID=47988 RepID=UPI001BB3FD38|nr:hypothetical protein [Actinoplanes auranticolor]
MDAQNCIQFAVDSRAGAAEVVSKLTEKPHVRSLGNVRSMSPSSFIISCSSEFCPVSAYWR